MMGLGGPLWSPAVPLKDVCPLQGKDEFDCDPDCVIYNVPNDKIKAYTA